MISIYCSYYRDENFDMLMTFNRSELLSVVVLDGLQKPLYGFILKNHLQHIYISKDTYAELLAILKNRRWLPC